MVSVAADSIIGIVGSIIAVAILIGNAIFINNIRQELEAGNIDSNIVSLSAANFFFFTDIILAIVFGIYLIYNIYRVFTNEERRTVVTERVRSFLPGARAASAPGTVTEYHTKPETVVHGSPTAYVDPATGQRVITKPTTEIHTVPEATAVARQSYVPAYVPGPVQQQIVAPTYPTETRHVMGSRVSNVPPAAAYTRTPYF